MDRFDIVITAYRLNAVLPPAKALQRVLGLSEGDAGVLAKRFPCVVRADQAADEAQRLCRALNEAGAYAELQACELPEPETLAAPSVVEPAIVKEAVSAPRLRPSPAAPEEAPSPYAIGDLAIGPEKPRAVERVSAPQRAAAPIPEPVTSTPAASAENAVSGNVQMLDDGFGGEAEHGPELELDFEAKGGRAGGVDANAAAVGPGAFEEEDEKSPEFELDFGKGLGSGKVEVKTVEQPKAAANPAAPKQATNAVKKPEDAAEPLAGAKYAVHGASVAGPARGQINIRDKGSEQRGFLATVFLPLVLLYSAAPRLCIWGGLALVSGVVLYLAYGVSPHGVPVLEQAQIVEEEEEELLPEPDRPGKITPSEDGKDKDEQAASPSPLPDAVPEGVKAAAMASSEASSRRERMHGVHKVKVTWPVRAKRDDNTECMLLDTKYTNKLGELQDTGRRVEAPPEVEAQLRKEADELQASKRYRGRTFLSVCLEN